MAQRRRLGGRFCKSLWAMRCIQICSTAQQKRALLIHFYLLSTLDDLSVCKALLVFHELVEWIIIVWKVSMVSPKMKINPLILIPFLYFLASRQNWEESMSLPFCITQYRSVTVWLSLLLNTSRNYNPLLRPFLASAIAWNLRSYLLALPHWIRQKTASIVLVCLLYVTWWQWDPGYIELLAEI